jgi:uncharacterized membrane protein YadS
MMVIMPLVSNALGLPSQVGGAWIASTIDTTAAVVAGATMVDPTIGLQVGSLVKMSQNVLIGFAAFFMAIWFTFSSGQKAGADRPKVIEIWYRFPKFIIGFVLASVIFSLIVEPAIGTTTTTAVLRLTRGYREWFFVLALLSIGLETRFKELITVGGGRPAGGFVAAQAVNILWALLISRLLWSGTFFPPVIG